MSQGDVISARVAYKRAVQIDPKSKARASLAKLDQPDT